MEESMFLLSMNRVAEYPGRFKFYDVYAIERMAEAINRNGQEKPILVTELGDGYWMIVDGHLRYAAMNKLGAQNIQCKLAPTVTYENAEEVAMGGKFKKMSKGHHLLDVVKQKTDVMEWAIAAGNALQHFAPQVIADYCGVPRSTVLDRIEMLRRHRDEIAKIETHARQMQKIEAQQLRRCQKCGTIVRGMQDLCFYCSQQDFHIVRCLEPACGKTIRDPADLDEIQAKDYFCKIHRFSEFPEIDRDGDPIWVTKDMRVLKVSKMSDDHLTNSLVYLMDSAKKRCAISGIPEDQWEKRMPSRYKALKAEATRRDEALRKCCNDGIVGSSLNGVLDEEHCTKCEAGRTRTAVRKAAEEMAKSNRRKMTVSVAAVSILALITGGAIPQGLHVVSMFIDYLQAMGKIK